MSYIFNEGFDGAAGSAPNGANWNIETGPGSSNDWGANNEQYYVNNQNILYQDGASNLIFKVGQLNTDGASGGEWPSGRVNTAGLYTLSDNQSCEIKVKVSPLLGLWPACWFVGGTYGTSGYAEVDMQESGDNNDNTYNVSSVTFWEGATPTNINSDATFTAAPTSGINPIPAKIAGGYWASYENQALGSVSSAYNLLYIFQLTCNSTGSVSWGTPSGETEAQFLIDLQAKRKAGVCCLVTVGGAGVNVPLTSRTNSNNFISSVESLYSTWGGFDGIDFDIENNSDVDSTELVYIAQQLKAWTPGFNISVAGFSPGYIPAIQSAAQAMSNAGVLDLVDVECYSFGDSNTNDQISDSESYLSLWAGLVGAGKIAFGMELANNEDSSSNTYASYTTAETVWNWALVNTPGIRGVFNWNTYLDTSAGGGAGTFVSKVIPYSDPTPVSPPSGGNNYVLDGNYHIWRFDMITTSIKIYIDGSLWCTLLKSNAPAWPYDGSPGMNIVLNVAVAPANGYGTPNAAQLPWQSMAVDYVRIWSPAGPDPNTASTFVVGKETIKLQSVKMAAIN